MKLFSLKLAVAGIAIAVVPLHAQSPTTKTPTFAVVSVKPSMPGARQEVAVQPGGRFVASGVSLKLLIAMAYHLQAFQMSGGESWMAKDQWSIEAEADDISAVPAWVPPFVPNVIAIRLRSLLEDRFALKTHRKTTAMRVYALSVATGGSKLPSVAPPPQPAARQPDAPASGEARGAMASSPTPPPGAVLAGPGAIIGSAMTMDQVEGLLGRLVGQPVIDKTGLVGYFDVRLRYDPETAPDNMALGAIPAPGSGAVVPALPSLFTALREQLGLELKVERQPVEVLVIDSAQKPTAN